MEITKYIAQEPVQVVALKAILVAGEPMPIGGTFTMPLEEFAASAGQNIELAAGEQERIQAILDARQCSIAAQREQERQRQAEEHVNRRLFAQQTTAAANARAEEGKRRQEALERLISGAMDRG